MFFEKTGMRMAFRSRVSLAWSLAALAILLNGSAVALGWGRPELPRWPASGSADVVWAAGTSAAAMVGALIAARRPRNPVGWLATACVLLVIARRFMHGYAYRSLGLGWDLPGASILDWVTAWMVVPLLVLLAFVFLLFPDGLLPSPWWRWLAGAGVVVGGVVTASMAVVAWSQRGRIVVEGFTTEAGEVLPEAGVFLWLWVVPVLALVAAAVASLVVRYWYASGEQRLQIKWFVYASSVLVPAVVVFHVEQVPQVVSDLALAVSSLLLFGGVAAAILRYRLYEIDQIISRTISYGLVVAALGAIYAILVVGLGSAVTAAAGPQRSDLAVAASVLTVAALFRPLRNRLQAGVDRRFNRTGYQARRVAEAFARNLRDEVDLETIRRDLLRTGAVVMQPASISLWLLAREQSS